MPTGQLYRRAFFEAQGDGSLRSAGVIVPEIVRLLAPERVIDLGCGTGAWLRVFREHGVRSIMGIDGGEVDADQLQIPTECFVAGDLTQRLSDPADYDLALSLEVGEHLPCSSAAALVRHLTQLAPAVLFSAAIPRQLGVGHINGQWQDWWADLFRAQGFVVIDPIRRKVWDDPRVKWWYAQNMLLYVHQETYDRSPILHSIPNGMPLRIVHPRMAEQIGDGIGPEDIPLRMHTRRWLLAACRAIGRRVSIRANG